MAETPRCARRLVLLTPQAAASKLARLKRRKLVKGAPESLINAKAGTWREPGNLK